MSTRSPKILNAAELDRFVEKRALKRIPRGSFYLVIHDAIDDIAPLDCAKAFRLRSEATLYARSIANGNMDWRVLHVQGSTQVRGSLNRRRR